MEANPSWKSLSPADKLGFARGLANAGEAAKPLRKQFLDHVTKRISSRPKPCEP